MDKRIIVGISGASGIIYSIRLLQALVGKCETHLIISDAAKMTIAQESSISLGDIRNLSSHYHHVRDIGATIASGSFHHDGMIILPCSINTMAQIACGISSNLITRAADVTLKERRKLVLAVRESPLHLGHLKSLTNLAELGAVIAPPMPAFYPLPNSIEDIVSYSVGRWLSLLGLENDLAKPWGGLKNVNN